MNVTKKKSKGIFIHYINLKPMTLVQVSISNNGNSVTMIADRLLTKSFGEDFPSYEFEGNSPKIISRNNVGIGFAGSALYIDMAISLLDENISDFDEITKVISIFAKDTTNSLIEDEVFRVTRKSSNEFFSNPGSVPEDIANYIYGWLSRNFEFEFQCIVSGFDKNEKAKIVIITDNGDILNLTNFGMGSIGTGLVFSQIYFDQHQYKISMSETESLFFAFKAKKWAESHTGVGLKTDILLFRKKDDVLEIRTEDLLMQEMNILYENERERDDNIKRELLNDFIKNNQEKINEI